MHVVVDNVDLELLLQLIPIAKDVGVLGVQF
jgi:hypothetical protein